MESVSQLVWLYVKQRPFLKEVIREGVVNYSALARKISIEAFGSADRQNAVKMALIRMGGRMDLLESDLERDFPATRYVDMDVVAKSTGVSPERGSNDAENQGNEQELPREPA